MVKLTNKQLELLAKEIHSQTFGDLIKKETTEANKVNDSITLTKEEIKVVEAHVEAQNNYNKLRKKYNTRGHYYGSSLSVSVTLQETLASKKTFLVKDVVSKYPTIAKLEADLTLATIDATTMNDLVTIIKSKYKVK